MCQECGGLLQIRCRRSANHHPVAAAIPCMVGVGLHLDPAMLDFALNAKMARAMLLSGVVQPGSIDSSRPGSDVLTALYVLLTSEASRG